MLRDLRFAGRCDGKRPLAIGWVCSGLALPRADLALAIVSCFFCHAEAGIRDLTVTGVQTGALPIWSAFGGAGMAPAGSPSEIRLHPFSMSVDAPMWSAWPAGREPVNSGAAASAVEAASCL